MIDADGNCRPRVVALSGGVGGAKLVLGLSRLLDESDLLVVANTGDDFVHLGLNISPDVDTLVYTLAGLADPERGWGREDETWAFMEALAELGGETWFSLGDRDLALHLERTRRLAAGATLTEITRDIARKIGAYHPIVPMSDDPVRTIVGTENGDLEFQDYFVRRQCGPRVRGLRYEGAASAKPNPSILKALSSSRLGAVVICPSNPFVSVDPILAIPGLKRAISEHAAPVVAVSPIVAGAALKGPTAKMMAELGIEVSVTSIARHYLGVADAVVIDEHDSDQAARVSAMGLQPIVTKTVMASLDDKVSLAGQVLDVGYELAASLSRVAQI